MNALRILLLGTLIAPLALAVVGIRSLLQLTTLPKWVADLLALGGGAGTLLLSYSVTFNNHTLAAGLITVAYATTVFEGPKRRHQVLAGLFAGLAAAAVNINTATKDELDALPGIGPVKAQAIIERSRVAIDRKDGAGAKNKNDQRVSPWPRERQDGA